MEVSKTLREESRECPRHGAYTSKIVWLNFIDREAPTGCPACAEEIRERDRIERESVFAEAVQRRERAPLEKAGIPFRFQDRSFANYLPVNAGARSALQVARCYADDFAANRKNGTCLIFSGHTGNGKTHLATSIAQSVMRQGYSVLFICVDDLLQSIKETWARNSTKTQRQLVAEFVRLDLLIVDEIGVQFDTDAERLLIFNVLHGRYENQRPTIILSNLPVDSRNQASIRAVLGDRVIDRLRENGGRVVRFEWESFRRNNQPHRENGMN